MRRFLIVLGVLLAVSAVTVSAYATSMLLMGVGNTVSSGAPPTCSNALDFSQACNSQYIPLVF